MLPMTPMNEDLDRILENVERGIPESDAPAQEGGFGAVDTDLTKADEALKQEGSLDQEIAKETKDK